MKIRHTAQAKNFAQSSYPSLSNTFTASEKKVARPAAAKGIAIRPAHAPKRYGSVYQKPARKCFIKPEDDAPTI